MNGGFMSSEIINRCPCGLEREANECCLPIIAGTKLAPSAEALMRARYSAHATQQYEFLTNSAHPEFRDDAKPEDIEKWSSVMEWQSLEILSTKDGGENDLTGEVSFRANYTVRNYPQVMEEDAFFRKEGDTWYYVEGTVKGKEPYKREIAKIGRNDDCHCGSGKKYKKCCMSKDG